MTQAQIQRYLPEGVQAEYSDGLVSFEVTPESIVPTTRALYREKSLELKLVTATDERKENGCFRIWYVFGVPRENVYIVPFISLKDTEEFPSISPFIHEAGGHERKIQTFFGLVPLGHPDPRSIILHENWPNDAFPLRKDFDGKTRPPTAKGTYEFQRVDGEGIYEIPVGPIHAGIIEPGHFRFSVAGEEIMLLEGRLGFVHKGVEKLFESFSAEKKLKLSERISGDSTVGHSLAFAEGVETLSGITVPPRARYLRVVYAELERIANHCGDIGAIMVDTGFNFGGAHGARLRELVLQLNERLTGSRFLRGVTAIGGVARDIDKTNAESLIRDIQKLSKDFEEVIAVAENSISLSNRLKDAGTLSYASAKDYGVVGLPARAVGIPTDARVDFPYAAYRELGFEAPEIEKTGDVDARFHVRIKEVRVSFGLIVKALQNLPEGPIGISGNTPSLKKNAIAVGSAEGWRGEIVYFLRTDAEGTLTRVAPRDPSFLNWPAVGEAGFGNMVPDFPLINKSFNLSYSGNDL